MKFNNLFHKLILEQVVEANIEKIERDVCDYIDNGKISGNINESDYVNIPALTIALMLLVHDVPIEYASKKTKIDADVIERVASNNRIMEKIKAFDELNVLTLTIFSESKFADSLETNGIGSVLANRRATSGNKSYPAICLGNKYISCWNKGIPRVGQGEHWDYCQELAKALIKDSFNPIFTCNAYYNPKVFRPAWAYKNGKPLDYCQVGNTFRFLII